jgi:ABC-type multidrug transport system fused ATPase/permease subunit
MTKTSASHSSMEEGVSLLSRTDKHERALSSPRLVLVLWPYFWPSKGSDGVALNRLRSTATWVMVILSKTCSILAPLYLALAANGLGANDLPLASSMMVWYCALRLLSVSFRELQSILYIKVKQQAAIQLQEMTFTHLHSLSLHWHLSKKTGSVMKSMDRGVEAANTIVTSLFLYLIPALGECVAVAVLFFVKYLQWQLGVIVVSGVGLYIVVTVAITNYRRSFREQANKHDNDYHDKATDSIINYETVKYFTGEAFEIQRFTNSVVQFQLYSSSTQLSINVLNVSQQVRLF